MILMDEVNSVLPEWMHTFEDMMKAISERFNSSEETIIFTVGREAGDAFILGVNFSRQVTISAFVHDTKEYIKYVQDKYLNDLGAYDVTDVTDPLLWVYTLIMSSSNISFHDTLVNVRSP